MNECVCAEHTQKCSSSSASYPRGGVTSAGSMCPVGGTTTVTTNNK